MTTMAALRAEMAANPRAFPPFDLARLFRTVFLPGAGESVGVFSDMKDPKDVVGLAFLAKPDMGPQRHAWHTVFEGLVERKADLQLADVRFYAYQETGGSNLDLPATVTNLDGSVEPLEDAFKRHSIVLFMGTYSATAPATALAHQHKNRGATMHGCNDVIVRTGYAVDYLEVSARAERLRQAMTRADRFRIEWAVEGRAEPVRITVELHRQEAQKSHGLVRTTGDIANLPAGEVYYVPTGCEGQMPIQLEDAEGTIAIFDVTRCRIVRLAEVVRGSRAEAEAYMARIESDPYLGAIGELGLGTQTLPFAGTDIQDEKILGTAHLATGRSDHLGGDIGPKAFKYAKNASHNDILWAPEKTPAIDITKVVMEKDGVATTIIEHYEPTEFMRARL